MSASRVKRREDRITSTDEQQSSGTFRKAANVSGDVSPSLRAKGRVAPLSRPLPPAMQVALDAAQAAAKEWRALPSGPRVQPHRYSAWLTDQQQARAYFSMAQASLEAWRREAPWATEERVVSELSAYTRFIEVSIIRFR